MKKSIYTNISQNKFNTAVVISAFISFVVLIVWFFSKLYAVETIPLVGLALIVSGVTSFISYYNSDKLVLSMVGAHEINPQTNPYVYNLVENMSIASGLPMPKVYMIDDAAMNAFATGRDPEHSAVCFTRGIVEKLSKRELEGVVAHEMSHIGNYDIRLMSIVAILVGSIVLISDWLTRGVLFSRDSNDRRGNALFMIIGLILLILSPIIANLIKLALSRNREYLADATGALMTRNPTALADALRKLSQDPTQLNSASHAHAHMFITNPFKGERFASLFSTHPPVEERIKRLEQM